MSIIYRGPFVLMIAIFAILFCGWMAFAAVDTVAAQLRSRAESAPHIYSPTIRRSDYGVEV